MANLPARTSLTSWGNVQGRPSCAGLKESTRLSDVIRCDKLVYVEVGWSVFVFFFWAKIADVDIGFLGRYRYIYCIRIYKIHEMIDNVFTYIYIYISRDVICCNIPDNIPLYVPFRSILPLYRSCVFQFPFGADILKQMLISIPALKIKHVPNPFWVPFPHGTYQNFFHGFSLL